MAAALDFETNASYTLGIQATDVEGNVGTGSVTVTVADKNDAPTVSDFDVNAAEDGTVPLGPLLTMASAAGYDDDDSSDSVASVALLSLPQHGDLSDGTGTLISATIAADTVGNWTYTPDADFNGTDSFTISFTDDGAPAATSETITVTVTVSPKDDQPILRFTKVMEDSGNIPVGIPSASTDLDDVIPKAATTDASDYNGSQAINFLTVDTAADAAEVEFSDTNHWQASDSTDLTVDLSDTGDQIVDFLTATDADDDFDFSGSNVIVYQYEVISSGGNGWLPSGNNGWEISEDFSVNSLGALIFNEDTGNGIFADDDVVMLAFQATDSAGTKSDFFMMDVEFIA